MKALKSHELNFLTKYNIDPKKIQARKTFILYSIPVVILVGVLSGIIFNKVTEKTSLENEITYQMDMLSDPITLEEYDRALYYSDLLYKADGEVSGISAFNAIMSSYPITGSAEISAITGCTLGDMRLTAISINSSTGIINLSVYSENPDIIPEYVRKLKDTGLFSHAEYTGYIGGEYYNNSNDAEYIYTFSVILERKAPEVDFSSEDDFSEEYEENEENEE